MTKMTPSTFYLPHGSHEILHAMWALLVNIDLGSLMFPMLGVQLQCEGGAAKRGYVGGPRDRMVKEPQHRIIRADVARMGTENPWEEGNDRFRRKQQKHIRGVAKDGGIGLAQSSAGFAVLSHQNPM